MIEERDDIQALSEADQFLVCASILTSPHYQSENIEIDLKWVEKGGTVRFYNRPIAFLNENGTRNELSSLNIVCDARESDTNEIRRFFYTRSYNNENSVFFLSISDSALQFDTYVKNIPILMNAQKKSRPI